MRPRALPAEYDRITVGRADAVCAHELTSLVREVLAAGTLYDFARLRPDAEELSGRQPA